ncbi:hypothetical protein IBA8402_44900 [Pseudomonas syringae]
MTWSNSVAPTKKALLGTRHLEVATIDNQLRPLFDALIDETLYLGFVHGGDQRPHVRIGLHTIADLELVDARQQLVDEALADIADHHGNRDRHAALSGRAISRPDQGVGGLIQISIGHHDHMVLGPAQCLHALAMGSALLMDVLGDRGRADEGNGLDVRVLQQRIDRHLVTLHHIEDAIGQTGFLEQARHQKAGRWIALGRFEDEAVTGHQRHGNHPQGHHDRKVERRNPGADAQWLTQVPVIDTTADVVTEIALQKTGGTAGKFDDLDTAHHLSARVGQHFAVLAANDLRQFVMVLVQQFLELEHHPRPAQRGLLGPGRKRRLGRRNRFIHSLHAGQRNTRLDRADCRIKDIAVTLTLAIVQVSVDVVADHR